LLAALLIVAVALPRRDALRAAAGAAAVAGPIVLLTLALRPGWIAEFLLPFTRIAGAPVPRSTLFGLVPPDLRIVAVAIAIAIVVAAVAWARLRRPALALVIAVAVPASIFVVPYGWSYDHLVMLVSASVILALVADAPPPRRTAVLAALAAVFVLLSWTLFWVAFQRGHEGLSALTPLAVLALVYAALRARETPYRADGAR
jgi:hypothetical protein